MAIITQERDWNGIPVRIETNNETGRVEIYGVGQGSFGLVDSILFSSNGKGSDWTIPNLSVLTNSFNKANSTNSTEKEVQRAFFLEGYKIFNNDRAAVLNNPENYDSFRDSVIKRQQFWDQNTPLVTNPNTGLNINIEGEPTNLANQVLPNTNQETSPSPPEEANSSVISTGETRIVESRDENEGSTDTTAKAKSSTRISLNPVGLLRYPLANLEAAQTLGITYDYIKITVQDYQSSIGSLNSETPIGVNFNTPAVRRYSQSKASLGTIILPMTNNMGSTNGVSWGENNTNAVQLALLGSVGSFINNVANAQIDQKFNAVKSELNKSLQTAKGLIEQAGNNKDAVAALLSGYVVGNTSLATRASGVVINPNMELLFQGPKLRTFNFTFEFAPRFRAEAEVVRKIVKAFKMFSAPQIDETGAIFLRTPKIFQLDYIYNGDGGDVANAATHPYLNKIKPCALTSVNVNYTPGGKYMTYADGGSMVQTTMTLSFNELEPIYQSDYTGDNDHPAGY